MGVQGLWELLAPVGRRVSVETLAGKKLAIDASIWMIQFMKAMRDDKGEMVRNAHLLGFFRRICKLLYLRTKPVFVFDGGTPALKRRTVIARRRQRENAQAKIRKTAEKLLLNHLKAMRLKELAADIENQKQDLKHDPKGKRVVSDADGMTQSSTKINDAAAEAKNQEMLDELLAASLAAEEDGSLSGNASMSFGGIPSEENYGDDDEEMILPVMRGGIDPSILAALPPSMQLDLLVQMRENLIAENRQKYQKAKKAPAKFSELQIQAYLKTVAFRREIDEVQKSAAGRGVGGVQTSRIASEANREFIFSSSFTGDKQTLTSAGVEENGDMEHQTPRTEAVSSDSVNHISSAAKGISATGSTTNESRGGFHDDVETYLDESGRVRVSRVRAMGIRMTRDLQRNLDLMKEIEQEKRKENIFTNMEAISNEQEVGVQHDSSKDGNNGTMSMNNGMEDSLVQGESPLTNELSVVGNKAPMVISFFEDDNGNKCAEDDVDNLFSSLVAGDSIIPSAKVVPSEKHPCADSECSWEEGSIEETNCNFRNGAKEEAEQTLTYDNISDEAEVDWEEGVSDVPKLASPQKMAVSKGSLEEAAAFEEAIRRSLEDFTAEKSINVSPGTSDTEISRQDVSQSTSNKFSPQSFALEKDCSDNHNLPLGDNFQQNPSSCEDVDDLERLNNVGVGDMLHIVESPNVQLQSSRGLDVKTDGKEVVTDQSQLVSDVGRLSEEMDEDRNVCVDTHSTHQVTSKGPNEDHLNSKTSDANVINASENESEAIPSFVSCETTGNAISPARYSIKDIATDTAMDHNLVAEKDYGVLSEERKQYVEASKTALDQELLHLRQERIDLGDEQKKLERNAESVSSEMFAECQELLQMFGLPYIIAPMEAEAQCAYMELSNLVDGVVTDDSDVLLFGARNVFKNIFDDRKYVETYFMKDIESELGLSRDKLIRMALLLGSDYTEGISGIGIVNAIEVVHAFPEEDGLQKFREWLESPDPSILGKLNIHTGSTPRKRSSKLNNNNMDGLQDSIGESASDGSVPEGLDNNQSMDDNHTIKKIFMDKHRNVSKNWNVPSSFPSEAVISAYSYPQVDKSTEPFSWGKPDRFLLRKLCSEKFGWSNQKADELLVPVLNEYSKHETQLRLEAFYSFNERFAKIRSKRIKKAVKGITGNQASGFVDDSPEESSKAAKKRRVDPRGPNENESENSLYRRNDNVAGNENNDSKKSSKKQSEKKGIGSEREQSAVGHPDLAIWEESKQNTEGRLRRDGKGRRKVSGRGRGRGGQGMGRGKRKASPAFGLTESSPSDSSNDEQEVQAEDTGRLTSVRRSTRPRKHVKYASKEPDDSESSDQSNEKGRDDGAMDQEPEHDKDMLGLAVEDSCKDDHYIGGFDHSLNNDLCKDYLEVGGGFCEDEGEHKADPLQHVSHLLISKPSNGDLSLDGFSKDYLEMGGGFCEDEGEHKADPLRQVSCQPISKPGNDDLSPDGFSKDYLEVGGGFCEDEGEQETVPLPQVSCQPKTGDRFCTDKAELDDYQTHSVSSPSIIHDIHLDDTSGIRGSNDPSEQEPPKEDSGPAPSTGLRCMPFLRRKRRKT